MALTELTVNDIDDRGGELTYTTGTIHNFYFKNDRHGKTFLHLKNTAGSGSVDVTLNWPATISPARAILEVAPDNLIGYWRCNETSGTVVANAEGTEARDGSYETTGTTELNMILGLDGQPVPYSDVTDYIDIYSSSLASAFDGDEGTVFCYIKFPDNQHETASQIVFVNLWEDASNSVGISWLGPAVSQFIFARVAGGGTKQSLLDYATVTPNTDWFSLGGTWSKTNDELTGYFDGVAYDPQTNLGSYSGDLVRAAFANDGNTNVTPITGYPAHLAIWDTPLTEDQMRELNTYLILQTTKRVISIAFGEEHFIGPFPKELYGDGLISIELDNNYADIDAVAIGVSRGGR